MLSEASPKIAQKPVSVERERLTSLINSMADGVIATDDKVVVLLYNGAALNILDLNSSMQGKTLSSVLKLIDKNGKAVDVNSLILSAKTPMVTRDMRLSYEDSSQINLYISIAPVKLGFGQESNAGYVIVLRDITREKSLEEERDEFISVVSHELRTPIAVAEGNVSNAKLLIEKSADKEKINEALEQTYNQIEFLAGLINDLATLSRAERGKLTVEVESINVAELVNELAKNYQPEIAGKGLKLDVKLDPSLVILNSSKLYVREILQNLITNAIKYTDVGGIGISASKRDDGVLFEIRDTGIGISKQDRSKIFEKFFRSEDYRTRKNNGTGLGLYVTRKLAGLLKAEVAFESELNKGTVFRIFIPSLKLQ
ncbi:MAG TPA: ATP-binding protein [Candidatus Saccharimonadales bacterium]|nr:ATP-binding protein [Candidatus Saccharimonadales bacterium]